MKKKETAADTLRKPGGARTYSRRRIEKDEERRANESGLGTTRQSEALYRKYGKQLEVLITADRINGRRLRDVWAALKDLGDENIAERLLKLGLTVAYSPTIGVDGDGVKNPRDVVLWLGDKLSQLQRKNAELDARIGAWGVSLLLNFPDLFTLDDKVLALVQTQSLADFRKDVIERAAHNNPYLLPSTKRSTPWTGVRQGPEGNQIPLVSRRYSEPVVQQAIESGEMRRVLDAVNALQDVWWTINEPILNIAKELPPQITHDPCARQKVENYHRDIELAEVVLEHGPFNVPHKMDFRGRVDGIPTVKYQGPDHFRGLFKFYPGEPLGERGVLWLKYHVAGCADGNSWSDNSKPSKLGFDSRVAWTDRHLRQICGIADDVLNGVAPDRSLLPEDKIQFLAGCAELRQALDAGPDFTTTLPVRFDGCCSGLQHFCGLMKAPEGRLAGLSPGEVADDFYMEVVKRVHARNAEILDGTNDRKIVKQPTQTYFYGASADTMCDQIKETLEDLGRREVDDQQIKKLAKAIHKVCGDLAPAAKQVRKFIGRLAKLYADEGKALSWTTKSGFPVLNEYHVPNIKEGIAVRLGRKWAKMNLVIGDLPEIDGDGSRRSATANFIHSLDAAHLHEVVWEAKVWGIRTATVHDCFACLAPRADKLNYIIRERFAALHALSFLMLRDMLKAAKRDLSTSLLLGAKLPELPVNHGPYLDLVQIIKSPVPGWT